MSSLDERLLPDLVQADVPWAVLSQQAALVLAGAALPGRMRPAICSGEQSWQSCSSIQATRSGRLMSRSWRGIFRLVRARQSAVRARQPDLELWRRSSRPKHVWLRPGYVVLFRQLVPWLQIIRSRCILPGSGGYETCRPPSGCLLLDTAKSPRIPPCPFHLFSP